MKNQQLLAIEMAEYILTNDREENDYIEWCDENNMNPFIVGNYHLSHIYAKAKYFMHGCGYEWDDYTFIVKDL